jgi:rhamnose transport system permease protein
MVPCHTIFLLVVVNSRLSPFFQNTNNLFRTILSFMEMGLMMLPMVFIIITGNVDLSVASILGMTASFMGWLFNLDVNIWVAAAARLLGGLAGLLNGYLIA